jgi:uncharacterized RDD family membrane protein YckC
MSSVPAIQPADQQCNSCEGRFSPDDLATFGESRVCAACQPAWVQALRQGTAEAAVILPQTYHYAGFWIRLLAQVIDMLILLAAQFTIGLIVGLIFIVLGGRAVPEPFSTLVQVAAAVAGIAYYSICWTRWGATPGKMIVGIKVIDQSGGLVSQAVSRWFGQLLSGFLLGYGFLKIGWSPEKMALHDGMAGTRVVYKR